MGKIIGIDLGTTNSCVAVMEEMCIRDRIYVHVCGCVKKPGVYSLHFGARTQEAINAAGGFSEKANQTAWNLAEVLQDGMQIYVPSKDEAKEALNEEQSSQKDLSASQRKDTVNINRASKEDLVLSLIHICVQYQRR